MKKVLKPQAQIDLLIYLNWVESCTSICITGALYMQKIIHVQVNLIVTLSLGSMETDHVISELRYNEVICNRHIAK